MELFKNNIVKYEQDMGLSTADLAELAEMTISEVEAMEKGEANISLISKLCAKLEFDFQSVYSDGGIKQLSALDQYNRCPIELKKAVTRRFSEKISRVIKNSEEIVTIPFAATLQGKFKIGHVSFNSDHLKDLQKAMEPILRKKDFYIMLALVTNSKIPNYNYMQFKSVFNLSYVDISQALGTSMPNAGSWGGIQCSAIPEDKLNIVLSWIGGMPKSRFLTIPVTEDEMKGYTLCFKPGPLREAVKREKPKAILKEDTFDFPDPPSNDDIANPEVGTTACTIVEKEKPVYVHMTKVETDVPEHTAAPTLTNDQALKLYSVLSDEYKAQVNKLIADLFFGS